MPNVTLVAHVSLCDHPRRKERKHKNLWMILPGTMCIKSSESFHLSNSLHGAHKRWQLNRNQVRLKDLLNDSKVRKVYSTPLWGGFMLCGCPRWGFCVAALFLCFTDSSLLCHSDRFGSSREWGMDSCVQFLFCWLGSAYSWYRL